VSSPRLMKCFGLLIPWLQNVDNIDYAQIVFRYIRSNPLVTSIYVRVLDEGGNTVCDLGSFGVTQDVEELVGACNVIFATATRIKPVLLTRGETEVSARSPIDGYAVVFAQTGAPGHRLEVYIEGSLVASVPMEDVDNDGIFNAAVVVKVAKDDEVQAVATVKGATVVLAITDVNPLRVLTMYVMEQPVSNYFRATNAQIFACYAILELPQIVNEYVVELLSGG